MGILWPGSEAKRGHRYEAVGCFEHGLVWDGYEPSSDSQAVACYGKGYVWSGADRQSPSQAIGTYDDERIWNGYEPGGFLSPRSDHEAVGFYADGLVWAGSERGHDYEAVGAYVGSPPGAIAAALVFLLGGGEESSDASEDGSDDHDSSADSDDDHDSDEDDSDDNTTDDDATEEEEEEEEDDEEDAQEDEDEEEDDEALAERARHLFSLASTEQQLEVAYISMEAAGVSVDTLDELADSQWELIETARIERVLREIDGRTVDELRAELHQEVRALVDAYGKVPDIKSCPGFERLHLAELKIIADSVTDPDVLRLLAENDDLAWTVLAKRRLKEIKA